MSNVLVAALAAAQIAAPADTLRTPGLHAPVEIVRDRAARLFAYRGDMTRELASYHPRGAAIVRAFVDGVNARVAQVERDSSLLPPELRRLGIRPGRWTAAVVVSRHNALAAN